jgi:hypothetical protein
VTESRRREFRGRTRSNPGATLPSLLLASAPADAIELVEEVVGLSGFGFGGRCFGRPFRAGGLRGRAFRRWGRGFGLAWGSRCLGRRGSGSVRRGLVGRGRGGRGLGAGPGSVALWPTGADHRGRREDRERTGGPRLPGRRRRGRRGRWGRCPRSGGRSGAGAQGTRPGARRWRRAVRSAGRGWRSSSSSGQDQEGRNATDEDCRDRGQGVLEGKDAGRADAVRARGGRKRRGGLRILPGRQARHPSHGAAQDRWYDPSLPHRPDHGYPSDTRSSSEPNEVNLGLTLSIELGQVLTPLFRTLLLVLVAPRPRSDRSQRVRQAGHRFRPGLNACRELC